jgi:hypothetical protein
MIYIPILTFPSLKGTLAKRTKPTLHPNFAKKPFSPSRSNADLRDNVNIIDKQIVNINRQRLTTNISNLGVSGLLKDSTFNQNCNCLIGKWLGNPSLLILANRWQQNRNYKRIKMICFREIHQTKKN